MNYRADIDGIRALAVAAVILHHFNNSLLPNGFLGVDIFFVLSGYVITGSLLGRSRGPLKSFLYEFYARRFKRLLPALLLVTLVTVVASSFFMSSPREYLLTGLAAAVGLSNIFLYLKSADYFGPAATLNPFTHTWSLGVEEQFYLIYPIFLWFLIGRGGPNGRGRTAYGLLAICSASIVLYLVGDTKNSQMAFYLSPFRMWELSAGALLCLLKEHLDAASPRARSSLSLVSCISVFAILLFLPEQVGPVGNILIVVATLLLLAAPKGSTTSAVFATRPFVWVGKISYSLYLWHWPVIVLGKWTIGVSTTTAPVLVGLIVALSWGSYSLVERPLRYAKWSSSPSRDVFIGLSSMAACAACIALLTAPFRGVLYLGAQPNMAAIGVQTLQDDFAGPSGLAWRGQRCVITSNSEVGKEIPLEECTIGGFGQASRRVLVAGNSFSAAFVEGFAAVAENEDVAFLVTSSWGASAVPEVPNTGSWSEASDYYWDQVVPGFVADLKAGDMVLLANDLASFSPAATTPESVERLRLLEDGLVHLSTELAAKGVSLAVIGPLPFARDAFCDPAAAVEQWFSPGGGPCAFFSREHTAERQLPVRDVLERLSDNGLLELVDLMDIFCPEDVCSYIGSDGIVLYRDVFSHPSVEAARASAPVIRAAVLAPS